MSNDNQRHPGLGTLPSQTIHNTNDPIARALKRLHDDVVAEPVPDDFLRLLSEIDRKIGQEKDSL